MDQHKEIEFEKEFAEYLAARGWHYSPSDAGYDRERALFPGDVLGWLADTQPEQLEKVVKVGSDDSIAWTAHRMARLQVDNRKVFDSVIVVATATCSTPSCRTRSGRSTTTPASSSRSTAPKPRSPAT